MNAITASPQATGLAVELNLDAALPLFFDAIADAFDSDPETVAGLLSDLAQTRRELHRAQEQAELGLIPDTVSESLGAEADRYREDLEEQLASRLVMTLSHREVLTLQQQLTTASGETFFGRLGRAS